MTKKENSKENSLKTKVKSLISENKEAITAAAAMAATELAPRIKQQIKTYIARKTDEKRNKTRAASHAPAAAPVKKQAKQRGRPAEAAKPVKHTKPIAAPAQTTTAIATAAPQQKQLVKISPKNIRHQQNIGHKLINTFTSLIGRTIRNFILWTFLSTAFFLAGAYFVFFSAVGRGLPLWYLVLLGIILFSVYTAFGFIYGAAMATLYTLKSFSGSVGELVREAVNRVKNTIEGRLDNIAENITHGDAADIVKQVFADLSRNVRQYAARTFAGVIAISALTGVLFLAKSMVMRGLHRIKNKADFIALLSARASLAIAVILNLKLFAKSAITVGWLIGLLAVATQVIIILWAR